MTGQETTIYIDAVRKPYGYRAMPGPPVIDLARSIEKDGLRRAITIWADGTLISGGRRLRAHFFLAGEVTRMEPDYTKIPAVVVDTVEEAGKRLLADNADEHLAVPMKPSEICRLWEVLRRLDEPAAIIRMTEARRQGVEHRRLTQEGKRKPGRTSSRGKGEEYLLNILGEPFGLKEATASRLFAIHKLATSEKTPADRRAAAAEHLAALDENRSSIWSSYSSLVSGRRPAAIAPRAVLAAAAAPAAKQRAAWDRSLPQLEGVTAGLVELGPPNADLTWEQVGPVHARLMKVRRDLEVIIRKMKETAQS